MLVLTFVCGVEAVGCVNDFGGQVIGMGKVFKGRWLVWAGFLRAGGWYEG